ncbi:hypothetical protein HanPI659440_Chr02g0038491 [Helianthus annuus]|nr:hypothetical protein HanPI659440_Chr02g0038491 [Helianthus annuus]
MPLGTVWPTSCGNITPLHVTITNGLINIYTKSFPSILIFSYIHPNIIYYLKIKGWWLATDQLLCLSFLNQRDSNWRGKSGKDSHC